MPYLIAALIALATVTTVAVRPHTVAQERVFEPPPPVGGPRLQYSGSGEPFRWTSLIGRWSLWGYDGRGCAAACRRSVHEAARFAADLLARDHEMVLRVHAFGTPDAVPGVHWVKGDPVELAMLARRFGPAPNGGLYFVDALGRLRAVLPPQPPERLRERVLALYEEHKASCCMTAGPAPTRSVIVGPR